MAYTVFIDGAAGTTGLELAERLADHDGFDLVRLSEAERRDDTCRAEALNFVDFAILCLPDEAARTAATLIRPESATRVIDASSAHRCASGWIYGFPEIVGRQVVAGAARVTNPGCYATGFIGLMAPLVRKKLLPRDWAYSVHAVSGYSGGGKALIDRFEEDRAIAWRGYALGMGHKHLPEMQAKTGITHAPIFSPAVIPAHRGMVVEVPIALEAMRSTATPDMLRAALAEYYADSPVVRVAREMPQELLLRVDAPPRDAMELHVFADAAGTQARLVAQLDNLGKGASGAALQSLNLMAGYDEARGLRL